MNSELAELNLNIFIDDNSLIDTFTDSDIRFLIDSSIVKLFGVLQANKIMYSIKKDKQQTYKLKTHDKYIPI
jgi:hypothetical protein